MTYQQNITGAMTWLGKQKKAVFVGEGIINAGRVYHTLDKVRINKCIEMPIAENLIAGAGVGLALAGHRPILVFQRMDFLLIAADALINHAALIKQMSGGQYTVPLIVRAIVGSQDTKFDVGPQHNHDFTHIFAPYMDTIKITEDRDALMVYKAAWLEGTPVLVVEKKDWYNKEMR